MPNWTTFSLEELRAATKANIIRDVGEYIATKFTKRQIIAWLVLDDVEGDRIPDRAATTYEDQDCVIKYEIWRDPETGDQVSGRVTTWSYFGTGEVYDIIISDYDKDNIETRRYRIRHSRDGKQPVMEDITPSNEEE